MKTDRLVPLGRSTFTTTAICRPVVNTVDRFESKAKRKMQLPPSVSLGFTESNILSPSPKKYLWYAMFGIQIVRRFKYHLFGSWAHDAGAQRTSWPRRGPPDKGSQASRFGGGGQDFKQPFGKWLGGRLGAQKRVDRFAAPLRRRRHGFPGPIV